MPFKSIRAKLNASAFGFLTIVTVLALISSAGTVSISHSLDAVSRKWISGSHILGELSDRVSEFRLMETYRALAQDSDAVTEAEQTAGEHAQEIEDLLQQYKTLVGPTFAVAEIAAMQNAWTAYTTEHKAWFEQEQNPRDTNAAQKEEMVLHELYKAADEASDALIERNQEAASAEAAAADQSSSRTAILILVSALCAGVLTIIMIGTVERRITGPLAAITSALSRLAAGHRDVLVPEANRADEIGAMAKAIEVFRSNAIALVEAQELAASLARHDALTGLPNRRLFASELEQAVRDKREGEGESAVMLIDLDRFKPVNDLHGHAIGDQVLCEVAARLTDLVAASGLVARLGGDEFVVLMRSPGDRKLRDEMVIRLAGRVVAALNDPFQVGANAVQLGASVGIALFPEDGTDADAILRSADLAMYRAKQDGRSTFRFFEQSMDEELRDRAALEADLRQALEAGEIRPYYQPLVSIADETIRGFEVLARWHHPVRGTISPDVFIPLVEQLNLMTPFTSAILRQACRDARAWSQNVYLAVNISPAQFQDPTLPVSILSVLNAEHFPPSRLELEVTESALVGDLDLARSTLEALQRVGIKVALDDFGTGYSSLYHLRELKFDKIKIDRSFVQSMQQNGESQKIVDAVLGLARSLGMPAVAEGIEDESAKQILAARGCTLGQGYHFSRAIPASEVAGMLAKALNPERHRLAS